MQYTPQTVTLDDISNAISQLRDKCVSVEIDIKRLKGEEVLPRGCAGSTGYVSYKSAVAQLTSERDRLEQLRHERTVLREERGEYHTVLTKACDIINSEGLVGAAKLLVPDPSKLIINDRG